MSEEIKQEESRDALDVLAVRLQALLGTVTNTKAFVGLLTDAIEMDGEQMEATVRESDAPDRRLSYLAGRQSAYRDLRRGALRALELAGGQPPSGKVMEPMGGDAV